MFVSTSRSGAKNMSPNHQAWCQSTSNPCVIVTLALVPGVMAGARFWAVGTRLRVATMRPERTTVALRQHTVVYALRTPAVQMVLEGGRRRSEATVPQPRVERVFDARP